jgi:hypothetical protein
MRRLLSAYAAAVATWVLVPSLAMTLIAGLLAIAANRAFHNAGLSRRPDPTVS